MKSNIELPTMDIDGKSTAQVIIPNYTVVLAPGTYPVQSKLFRAYVGEVDGVTIKWNHNGVVNESDAGLPVSKPLEYFGALPGDTITIAGGSVAVTWSY